MHTLIKKYSNTKKYQPSSEPLAGHGNNIQDQWSQLSVTDRTLRTKSVIVQELPNCDTARRKEQMLMEKWCR